MPAQTAILFVANLSYAANAQYLERLFSAYGEVQNVEIVGDGHQRYAEVTFASVDDADTAVAALHYRYRTARNLPLIVLYSQRSPCITQYGRLVGREFVTALEEKRMPEAFPLDAFDPCFERTGVQPPPSESDIIPENGNAEQQLFY